MHQDRQIKTANWFRNIARYSILSIGMLVFIFALLSGAEEYGGGLHGIIKNSPNALPWVVLLVIVLIAWKWELVGGILIILLGIFAYWLVSFQGNDFNVSPFIIFLCIILMGEFFLISWYLRRDNASKNFN